jgi:hypothetical protein
MIERISMGLLVGTIGLAAACGSNKSGEARPDAGTPDANPPNTFQVTGCASAPTHPAAPGGYYVNGNTICTAEGRAHLFHGVDRPSLEWSSGGQNLSPADFRLMASWNANVVRVALNQDFWIAGSPLFDPNYASVVDAAVAWAEAAGLDVILDLHWSDAGVLGSCVSTPSSGCQQLMPDLNSITFWSDVAARYQNDGRVMFELYNEPHGVLWSVWRSGGTTTSGFQAVGMQQLYDTVRATGAQNLVIIGGLDWAYDLSGVPANRIDGYNIAYATHPYNAPNRQPSAWDKAWGFLAETDPIIVTEFGDTESACATDYSAALIQYADAHATSWTAWAWYPGGCSFPALIDDWSATPSALGTLVKAALLSYGDPPASPPGEPVRGPALSYTFDQGTEGWILNAYDNPDLINLGARMVDGGAPPKLRFVGADGGPSGGALELTAAFTGTDQYVTADIALASPGVNLSGKTLHAWVRRVSGASDGGVSLYACSGGATYVCLGAAASAAQLAAGAWIPLTLDLSAPAPAGFDPTGIVEIGVQALSSPTSPDGGTADGGGFASTGDTVVEIDTVTD